MAGNLPLKDNLILTRGADFVARYNTNPNDPDIPTTATARIEILKDAKDDTPVTDTWNAASVDARGIDFRIESEQADPIPAGVLLRACTYQLASQTAMPTSVIWTH